MANILEAIPKNSKEKELPEEDKYQYLIQCMEAGSNAKNLAESYAPSKANYQNIVQMLKTRFARDEIVIETYVRDLLRLVVSKENNSVDI